jgi:hypothetical protein
MELMLMVCTRETRRQAEGLSKGAKLHTALKLYGNAQKNAMKFVSGDHLVRIHPVLILEQDARPLRAAGRLKPLIGTFSDNFA